MPESERAALAAPYDIEAVRKDFPILSREVYGKPLVYLDNGASAQKPQVVIDAVSHAYANEYANVHRGLHFLSNAATDAYEAAREKVRRFLNAGSVDEIVFTKSSTEAINTVAYGYGMPKIGEGDEIVISIMEHHSNIVPWHFIRERQGAKLVWVPVDDDGAFHIEAFEKSLTERTKLVAITHMSNALGTIVPVKEICRIAHERGIPVLIDGSQGAVHMPVDVRDIDCDWYVMTGHKLYGPSGIGVLYGKADRLREMRPFQGGGEMILDVTEDNVTITSRRTVSKPARRPSCRPSALVTRWITWTISAALRLPRMRPILPLTLPSVCARSIRCGSSAMRRTRAASSPSSLRAFTPMMSRW